MINLTHLQKQPRNWNEKWNNWKCPIKNCSAIAAEVYFKVFMMNRRWSVVQVPVIPMSPSIFVLKSRIHRQNSMHSKLFRFFPLFLPLAYWHNSDIDTKKTHNNNCRCHRCHRLSLKTSNQLNCSPWYVL